MRMHMRRCQDASPLENVADRAFLRGQTFYFLLLMRSVVFGAGKWWFFFEVLDGDKTQSDFPCYESKHA